VVWLSPKIPGLVFLVRARTYARPLVRQLGLRVNLFNKRAKLHVGSLDAVVQIAMEYVTVACRVVKARAPMTFTPQLVSVKSMAF
jgi:hypothetical protein